MSGELLDVIAIVVFILISVFKTVFIFKLSKLKKEISFKSIFKVSATGFLYCFSTFIVFSVLVTGIFPDLFMATIQGFIGTFHNTFISSLVVCIFLISMFIPGFLKEYKMLINQNLNKTKSINILIFAYSLFFLFILLLIISCYLIAMRFF